MKRFISIFITVLLCLSIMMPVVFAENNYCDCEHVPIIYIYGRQDTFDDPNSPDRIKLNDINEERLTAMVKEAIPYLEKAVLTNRYDEYNDFLVKQFIENIGDFGLDKEGNLKNSSGIDYNWSPENPNTLRDDHIYDNVYSYVFLYDARRDPLEVADDLKVFIQAVKDVTGHNSVNIVSRCMGSEYAISYFVKYGWSDIETFVQNCSSANGTDVMSELFSGKIKLNGDAIDRFVTEDVTKEPMLQTIVSYLNQAKILGLSTSLIEKIFNEKIREKIVPEIMINEYATCPGYWSMVSAKDYEDAKKLIFGGREDEYATLIAKIDNYDKLVRQKLPEILTAMHNDGVKLCTIAKYGFQLQPFTESYNLQSDDKISVLFQSYGAMTANQGETFSKEYISKAEKDGTIKYISPDRIIDASTCLFPDTTWFMKDIRHNNFPGCVNELYLKACRSEKEFTIYDDENLPQYTRHYYWENKLVPLTTENTEVFEYTTNFFTAFRNLFRLVIERIKAFFRNPSEYIKNRRPLF